MLDVGCWMLDVGCWMLNYKKGLRQAQADKKKELIDLGLTIYDFEC